MPDLCSVWGVLGKPETYRFVFGRSKVRIYHACINDGHNSWSLETWNKWKAKIGAVELLTAAGRHGKDGET